MRRRLGLLFTGMLLMATAPSFAQDTSRGEVSAGWRYYHVTLSSVIDPFESELPNDFPKGWYADVAVNLSPQFSIVGEVGGTYDSIDSSRTTGPFTVRESEEISFHTFMGGARVRAPQIPWFVPFGQVLFGGERDSSTNERTTTIFQNTSTNRRESSTSSPVLALDSGVTITAGFIGVRVSAGYVRFFKTADADAFRVNVGGAFRF